MREKVKFLLSQNPRIYDRILRLKHRKEYDNERIVFLNAIRQGDVVFDVGANRGIHTVLLSHLAGASGSVHAFEPVPTTFELLGNNLAAKKRFDNVRLNNCALGDKAGMITIHMPDGDDGQASIAKHNSGSWKDAKTIKTFECSVTTMDAYVATLAKPPDFIKCDVEGAELLALRGGRDTLGRHAPMLFLEVCKEWTRNFGYAPLDVLNYVRPFGYDLFYLVDDDGIRRIDKPDESLLEKNLVGSVDVLCASTKLHRVRLLDLR
ncbi:MAG: FkbM family methyltransferase [Planctomycetota bacterium]